MSEKSEVEKLFKDFYSMIENQIQTKISIFGTENGTKYFNQCGKLFERKGYSTSIHMSRYSLAKWYC